MTLSILLPKKTEAKLRKQAAATGKDVETFVREAVEEKLGAKETFAEILAPIHEAFKRGNLPEKKAMDLFYRTRDEVRRSNRKRRSGRS